MDLILELHENLKSLIGEIVIYDSREWLVVGYSIFYEKIYQSLLLVENIETKESILLNPELVENREKYFNFTNLSKQIFEVENK